MLDRHGRLDVLVNNAGGQYFAHAEAIEPKGWNAVTRLNVIAVSPLGRALSGSVITLDGARDNWFGPWPPPSLLDEDGMAPTEERRPRA